MDRPAPAGGDPRVTPDELSGVIRALAESTSEEDLRLAVLRGQERGVTLLKRKSPVDQGQYKNAWTAVEGKQVLNMAPHAGIIERGAKPHKVSAEGREALAAWVRRVIRPGPQKNSARTKRNPKFNVKRWIKKSVRSWISKGIRGAKNWIKAGGKWMGMPSAPRAAGAGRTNRVLDEEAVQSIVWAICHKLETEGQAPKWVARNVLSQLGLFAGQEVARLIKQRIEEGLKKIG